VARRRHLRWSDTVSENNAPATRAESARAVLIERPRHSRRRTATAFGERWCVAISSKFKAGKFWRDVMRPRRQPERGAPGAGRIPRPAHHWQDVASVGLHLTG
jgi:hypothetical protein